MDEVNEKGRSELHLAAYFEDYDRVKECVEAGFDVNLKDDGGWTPLVWAIDMASTSAPGVAEKIVEYLVSNGALMDFEPIPGKSFVDFAKDVDEEIAKCVENIFDAGQG